MAVIRTYGLLFSNDRFGINGLELTAEMQRQKRNRKQTITQYTPHNNAIVLDNLFVESNCVYLLNKNFRHNNQKKQ